MRLPARIPSLVAAGALVAAVAGCAPSASPSAPSQDSRTGTLRVWLFREVGNAPKQKVVDAAAAAFADEHEGVRVDVTYIPVETRAQRIKAAFNDPSSAPDVIEYGNTDTAGYVRDGGLADISEEVADWPETADLDPAAKRSVTVDGGTYGVPWFVGVRALYHRTDIFEEMGLEPPATQEELASTARKIRREHPTMYGIAVGGAYTYGAMPFLWAAGGELAREKDGTYTSAIDDAASKKGIETYTSLFGRDNCPPAKCAGMNGNATVDAFASGRAAMAIAGDFSHRAVEDGAVRGKYAVVPLPGTQPGTIAPAFAGGNNLGVLKSSSRRTLAVDFLRTLGGKEYQSEMFDAMGNLPTFTDTRAAAAEREPFVEPFVKTLDTGAKSVPASPAWSRIDAEAVLPTMFQQIVSGRKTVDAAAADAARTMDDHFTAVE